MDRLELLEDVGLELGIVSDRLDDLLAFAPRGGLDEVGELRRMEPREPRMRNSEPDCRDMAR